MAHTIDEIRKLRNGRGTSAASSSDSTRSTGHSVDEIRRLGGRNVYEDSEGYKPTKRADLNVSAPSKPTSDAYRYGTPSGNATLDQLNTMMSNFNKIQAVLSTPKNMPEFKSDSELKDYYESIPDYNVFERIGDSEKTEKYNQKQALSSEYNEIKKANDLATLNAYGITEDELKKAQTYLQGANGGIFNKKYMNERTSKEEMQKIYDKFDRVKEETGINPYELQFDYQTEIDEELANEHPISSTISTYAANPVESTLNTGKKVINYATGKPIENDYSYTNNIRNTITNNIDSEAGRFAYGTVNSIADMAVAAGLSHLTGSRMLGPGLQGFEKADAVMNESVNRGLNPTQVMMEGIASGITTAATESIPMGKWEEIAEKKLIGLGKEAIKKNVVKKLLAGMASEGLQEMSEDVADLLVDRLIAGDKSEIDTNIRTLMEKNPGMTKEEAEAQAWKDWCVQVVLDGVGGAISGGVMSGLSIGVGLANPYATGYINREALSEQIKKMDPESEVYKTYQDLAQKRGETLSSASDDEVSDLFQKAYAEASKADRTAYDKVISDKLKEAGYTDEQVKATLEALTAKNPTKRQKFLIDNELVRDAVNEADNTEGLKMVQKVAENVEAIDKTIKSAQEVKEEKRIAEAESKINTDTESSVRGNKVEIYGMDIKGGVYVVNTSKGSFPVEDVKIASDIQDAVTHSVNISDDNLKEAFVKNYHGQDISAYEAYAYRAFTAGKSFNQNLIDENTIDFLGSEAVHEFLDAGRLSVRKQTKESEERAIQAASEAKGKFKQGTFTNNVDYTKLDSTRKKIFNFLKGMSNIGGLHINVINDINDQNGMFQYDPNGGTITVNLAAGATDANGNNTQLASYVIPTLSHELTHYLQANAPSAYNALEKAVLKALRAEGLDIDAEVNRKIDQYKEATHGKVVLTQAEALDEIIAQSCEGMMSNEETMKKTLSFMNTKEVKTFKKALEKFFNAVKSFINSLAGSDAQMNRYAYAISKNVSDIQDAWAKAFAEALERQQNLNESVGLDEEMTADNGSTVVGNDYAQFNIRTYDKSLPFLKDWLKKSGLTSAESQQILNELENKKNMLEDIRKNYPHFDEWSLRDSQEEAIDSFGEMSDEEEAQLRKSVEKYLTAIVNNSEYPYNFDLTTVCKKRQTLNKVLNMLVSDGMFDDFIPDEKTMTDLVDLIKANGFEVACALCFVDSKRYRVGSWADSIVNGKDTEDQKTKKIVHSYGWNELVKSMEVKGKVSVNEFNFLDRDIDNTRPNRLASNMTVEELREAGATKLLDKIIANEKGNTRNKKFAKAILDNPSIAHIASVAELLSSDGLDIARIKAPDFHQIVNGASGQATPKLSHDAITYQNDILRKLVEKNVTPEDLYKVGGFRVQSFSDYVANEIFDYVQMVSELAANKFPSHAYTKEYFFVKLFGMTGMKINMSIVPKAFEDSVRNKFKGWSDSKKEKSAEYQFYKDHAGLNEGANKDGSYDWKDADGKKWHYIIEDESFGAIRDRKKNTYDAYKGLERALEIQSDERYNKNCGIIWVGVSDNHIRAMMRDDRIPMVIPYHKSSINHLVAEMRAIDSYNDYTDYQIEKYADGSSISKSDYGKLMKGWNFYDDLKKTNDPVQTSKNYIKYCEKNGLRPKFSQFIFEEGHEGDYDHFENGYYKLLTDFRLYGGDTNGNLNSEYAAQNAVTMTFPEEFSDLAMKSLEEYEADATYLDDNQKKLYEQAKKLINKNKKEQRQRYSIREDSDGNKLTEDQAKFFKDSKVVDENGNLKVMYHGTNNGGFTVFNPEFSDDDISLFFSDNEKVSESYVNAFAKRFDVYEEKPDKITNGKEAEKYLKTKGYTNIKSISYGGVTLWYFTTPEGWDLTAYTDPEFTKYAENIRSNNKGVYAVYLNVTNPLTINAEGRPWKNLASYNKSKAYSDWKTGNLTVFRKDDRFLLKAGEDLSVRNGEYIIDEIEDIFGAEFASIINNISDGDDAIFGNIAFNSELKKVEPNGTRSAALIAKLSGNDGVIFKNVRDNGGALGLNSKASAPSTVVVAFDSNQVKDIKNEHPTSNPDIRYSIREDSDGNKLTEDQAEFFKNSKVVDENGRLEVMYHGTSEADFTVFDPNKSDDKISFFFTNSRDVAAGYSGTDSIDIVNPYNLRKKNPTLKDLQNRFKDTDWRIRKDGDEIVIENIEDPDDVLEVVREKDVESAYKEWISSYSWHQEEGEFGGLYSVYLNVVNPYVVEANGQDWNEIWPKEFKKHYNNVEINTINDNTFEVDYEDNNEFHHNTMSKNDILNTFGKNFFDLNNEEVNMYYVENLYLGKDGNIIPTSTRDIARFAMSNGYDGAIINNVIDIGAHSNSNEKSKVVIAFNSNQIKSTDNINPTDDKDIRYSIREDSDGNKLTEEQAEFFKDSKIVDKNGNLKVEYHGTNSDFFVFDTNNFGGVNGKAEGYGIYFTDDQEITSAYGGRQLKGYVNITKPAYSTKKTIKSTDLVKLIKTLCENEAKQFVESGDYDSVADAIKDTWVSNYEYTYDKSMNEVYKLVADSILRLNSSDMDIIQEVMNGTSIYSYKEANEFYSVLKDTLGFDGFVTYWTPADGSKKSEIVVAFDSNQFKLADNVAPTENNDIRYSIRETDPNLVTEDKKEKIKTLKEDIALLKERANLDKQESKGQFWKPETLDAVAKYVIDETKTTVARKELREDLSALYNTIAYSVTQEDGAAPNSSEAYERIMNNCYKLASKIYEASPMKVKVDANVDPSAKQTIGKIKEQDAIQDLAIKIYNKYWSVKRLETVADKYQKKVDALEKEHKKNMTVMLKKQGLADEIFYKDIINKVKKQAAEEKANYKEKNKQKAEAQKEANERRAEIEKITDQAKTLSKWLFQNSKNHPIPDPLKTPLLKMLAAIDPSSKQLLGLNNNSEKAFTPTKKDESMSLILGEVAEALKNINQEVSNSEKQDGNKESGLGFLDVPQYMIAKLDKIAKDMHRLEYKYDTLGKKVLELMDLESLQELRNDISMIKTAISTVNYAISQGNKIRVNYVAQYIIQYLKDLGQAKRDALGNLARPIDFLTLDNTTPYYFFKHLGEGGEIVFNILADGMDKMTDRVERISDFTESLYTEEEQKKWRNNIREFELTQKLTETEKAEGKSNKVKVKLTDAQIMSLYCLAKREINGEFQGLDHMLRDGIVIGQIDGKKKVGRQDTVTITKSQLDNITDIVENDKRMKEVADGLVKFMSTTLADWGNEVTWARWGIKQFVEDHYFPIAVNKETTKSDNIEKTSSLFALLNQDFTKPLQKEVRNEIMVYDIFDVFTKHASDMARYSSLGLPILDTIKVWNYSESEMKGDVSEERNKKNAAKESGERYDEQRKVDSVKKSIAKAFGEKGGNRYISNLLKNLNGQADKGVYDNIGMGMMKRYKASKIAASTMTALVQPLSYLRAGYVMNPKYMLEALTKAPQVEKMFANVPVAKWKRMSLGVDTNIGRGVDRIINHQNTFGDKIVDKSLWLAEKMDELTWGYLYNACEAEIKATRKDLKPGTKEFDQAVADRAREVIYSTQIFDSTLTRSSFMRDKGYHAQMLSAFMSEPTLSYNMLLDSVTQYFQDAKKNGSAHAFKNKGKVVAKAISVYTLSAVVESVIREAFTRLRDYQDDDEEFFEDFWKDVIDRLKDELNILNKIPYAKQLMDAIEAFGKAYQNNNKMDEAFIQDIGKSIKAINKAIESEEISYNTVYTVLNALADVTGLPFGNALREVKMIWNNTIGRVTGKYIQK